MSVRNCCFPWHWALVTSDGNVLPCGHGSLPVGNLREQSAEEIWNGSVMQEVRASLLRGEVHWVCRSTECPFQREHPAFPTVTEPLQLEERFARDFDEAWYLDSYPDVAVMMKEHGISSGLEHFVRHGRQSGNAYRLVSRTNIRGKAKRIFDFVRSRGFGATAAPPLDNATLGLIEYSRGLTVLQARPADLVFAITTICNLRCVMCPQGMGLVENPRHMPVDYAERALPFVERAARIILSGIGEPTHTPAFWWIIQRLGRRPNLFMRVNSNGHFLDAGRAEQILNSGLSEISFSLDAATPETYAKIRGAPFERALSGIAEFVRVRGTHPNRHTAVFVNMTLMLENMHEAPALVELAAELGVDGVILTQLFTFGDRPDWRVERGSWTFVYSDQMPGKAAPAMRRHLTAARRCAEEQGIALHLRDNVGSYLEDEATIGGHA